jgi:UDP-N-acetylglucosamine 4,6-dehydratase
MKILVTGATGFFGRTFVHKLLSETSTYGPIERLAAFARSESRLAELTAKYADTDAYRPFLGDIRDYDRLVDACRSCDLVVHSAALKRVDDGSYNPSEMIATNIVGTQNVIKAATACRVPRVIIVSSDKAVCPINVYGATKFVGEQFATSYNSISAPQGTLVSVVRYGNVIGSTGSVLKIWQDQDKRKVPLTVTDPLMTRFVMTAGDACELVMKTSHFMEGGEIVIPLLNSVRLTDMADAVSPNCEITFTGKRVGGEKMDEILLNEDEQLRAVVFTVGTSMYLVIPPASHPWTEKQSWDSFNPVSRQSAVVFPYSSGNAHYLTHTNETILAEIARALAEHADII